MRRRSPRRAPRHPRRARGANAAAAAAAAAARAFQAAPDPAARLTRQPAPPPPPDSVTIVTGSRARPPPDSVTIVTGSRARPPPDSVTIVTGSRARPPRFCHYCDRFSRAPAAFLPLPPSRSFLHAPASPRAPLRIIAVPPRAPHMRPRGAGCRPHPRPRRHPACRRVRAGIVVTAPQPRSPAAPYTSDRAAPRIASHSARQAADDDDARHRYLVRLNE